MNVRTITTLIAVLLVVLITVGCEPDQVYSEFTPGLEMQSDNTGDPGQSNADNSNDSHTDDGNSDDSHADEGTGDDSHADDGHDGSDPDGSDPDGSDPDGSDPDGSDPDGSDPDRLETVTFADFVSFDNVDAFAEFFSGQWLVGHPDNIHTVVTIDGASATGATLGGELVFARDFTYSAALGNRATWAANSDASDGSQAADYEALFPSSNTAVVWNPASGGFTVWRRVGELDESMHGPWMLSDADGADADNEITLSSSALSFEFEDEVHSLPMYPLAERGDTIDIVTVSPQGRVDFTHIKSLSDDAYLLWGEVVEDYVVMYRSESRPNWLPNADSTNGVELPSDPWEAALVRLDMIAAAADTTYRTSGHFPPETVWSPTPDPCDPSNDGMVLPADWETEGWIALGFRLEGAANRMQYRLVSSSNSFSAQVRIDRDCDGVFNKASIDGAIVLGGGLSLSEVVEDHPGE